MNAGKGASGFAKGLGKANPLNEIDAALKVWVGGIPEGVTWKELQAHFEQVGKARWAELLPKGIGCVAYRTAEEVAAAIETLNGTELGGQIIEVDVWQGKPTGKGKGKSGGGAYTSSTATGAVAPVWKPLFQKPPVAATKGLVPSKGKDKGKGKPNPLRGIDAANKVWVGNLQANASWKALEEHFMQVGVPTWVELMPKGTACVAYKSPEEAAAALGLNGTDLEGSVLEVDVWESKPKMPYA